MHVCALYVEEQGKKTVKATIFSVCGCVCGKSGWMWDAVEDGVQNGGGK